VIVFSHGLWIRCALEQIVPELTDQIASIVLANTSVTVIDSGTPIGIARAACTAHLDPDDGPQGMAGI
jgi:broad specificity phosphatase PhoE